MSGGCTSPATTLAGEGGFGPAPVTGGHSPGILLPPKHTGRRDLQPPRFRPRPGGDRASGSCCAAGGGVESPGASSDRRQARGLTGLQIEESVKSSFRYFDVPAPPDGAERIPYSPAIDATAPGVDMRRWLAWLRRISSPGSFGFRRNTFLPPTGPRFSSSPRCLAQRALLTCQ